MNRSTRRVWLAAGCILALSSFPAARARTPLDLARKIIPKRGKSDQKVKHPSDNGIFVDFPKVYDNSLLTALLNSTQTALSNLSPLSSSALTGALGNIQGVSLDQTASNLQVLGGKGATNNASSLPQTTSPLSAPAAPSLSAADLLNSATELNNLIIGLRLLLLGALSDQLEPGTSSPKPRLTLGFPVSINVPAGYEYRNAVAEVEVSMCAPEGTAGEEPRLITILPQSKTYNVASLVTKSSQIGGGAVAQIFSVSGSLWHGRQTYYLVKDQDTVAFQRPPFGSCKSLRFDTQKGFHFDTYRPVVFGWQFRPVLGQDVVLDGLRQNFVQFSFSPEVASNNPNIGADLSCESEPVRVRARWRRFDPKTGRVGAQIGPDKEIPSYAATYYSPPVPERVEFDDNENGNLTVRAFGSFKPNTYVRIGSLILIPSVSPPSSTQSQNNPTSQTPAGNQPNSPAQTPPSGNQSGNPSPPAPTNSNANQGSTPAGGSTTPNQTTFQIQGTVQITSTPPNSSQGGTQSSKVTAGSAYVTANYISFTAPASDIALHGARLVNPDGFDGPVVMGYPLPSLVTCPGRLADYMTPTSPPVVYGGTVNGTLGQSFEYWIHADNSPETYDAIGLPQGLTIDKTKGLIYGTLMVVGTSIIMIEATNANGTGSGTLTLQIVPAADSSPNPLPSAGSGSGDPQDAPPLPPQPAAMAVPQPGSNRSAATSRQSPTLKSAQLAPLSTSAVRLAPQPPAAPQGDVDLTLVNDSTTKVTLKGLPIIQAPPASPGPIPVVLIGSTVFGLHDHPFRDRPDPIARTVTLVVPNNLLSTPDQRIIWKYLFEDGDVHAKSYSIPSIAKASTEKPSSEQADACAITGAAKSAISFLYTDSSKLNHYSILGTNLTGLRPLSAIVTWDYVTDTNYLFNVDSIVAKTVTSLIFECPRGVLASLQLPAAPSMGNSGAPAPSTAKPDNTITATANPPTIHITGSHLEQVEDIIWNGNRLTFTSEPYIVDKGVTQLNITDRLVPSILQTPGIIVPISLHLSDNSYLTVAAQIKQ